MTDAIDTGLHVAFGIDEAFVRPMGVSMTSIILNNPGLDVTFHIFSPGLSDDAQTRLNRLASDHAARLTFHSVGNEKIQAAYGKGSRPSYVSTATYIRLFVPDAVRAHARRVLYIDADVLCLGDLSEIMRLPFDGAPVMAVPEANAPNHVSRLASAGFGGVTAYFNAGVLCIDTDAWHQGGYQERTLKALLDPRLKLGDQDAINVVVEGIKPLERAWNWQHKMGKAAPGDVAAVRAEAKLLHYLGKVKPWMSGVSDPLAGLFLEYQAASPWSDAPLLPQAPKGKPQRSFFHRAASAVRRLTPFGR